MAEESGWHIVEDIDVETAEFPVTTVVEDERVVIFRAPDGLYACARRCPHQSADLSKSGQAITLKNQSVIRCMLHGIVFRATDGKALNFPGASLPIYEVAQEGAQLKLRKSVS